MADQTKKELRNKLMYQVFVRNYTEEGTFDGVRRDLDRIRDLGVDIVYLLPIHPIGEKCRKGSLGSPYAISDYRAVNPEYGTLEDFKALADAVHEKGMKIIIDVVYNHTSPDSVLSVEHPEWFYRKEDGSFGNHVGDWSDIIDLDYTREGLAEYQIETLKYWAGMVDGFRCDVAPFLPLAFWEKARKEVAEVNPDCLWLSESVEPAFIREMRDVGLNVLSDGEVFRAFDVCYDYDVFEYFTGYLILFPITRRLSTGRKPSIRIIMSSSVFWRIMTSRGCVSLFRMRKACAALQHFPSSRKGWLSFTPDRSTVPPTGRACLTRTLYV